ncbi:hypothetical protein BD779DRAFT_1447242, partial [Infundibulicybe gibba]
RKIPWSAFMLSNADWRLRHVTSALVGDPDSQLWQYFSTEKQPMLWCALLAMEELQTAWEDKCKDQSYVLYKPAITDGFAKLNKYYSHFDEKSAFVLSLILHLYYKLTYIKLAWEGEKEQHAEWEAGNPNVKNWQDKALKLVEHTMEKYWMDCPWASPAPSAPNTISNNGSPHISKYNRHCQELLEQDDTEGWSAELRWYLKAVPADVTKDMDIIEWWQVGCILL